MYSKFVDFMKVLILAQILGFLYNNSRTTLFVHCQQLWFLEYCFWQANEFLYRSVSDGTLQVLAWASIDILDAREREKVYYADTKTAMARRKMSNL